MRPNRAVFLDKDGTLIEDLPYNVNPDLIRLAPGAADGLSRLQDAGFRLFVVSNQAGVAFGRFPESALAAIEKRLAELLGRMGVEMGGFFYCPHHPEASVLDYRRTCNCRKPAPGMLVRAARENRIDLHRSWLIGDILDDIEAGRRAGCRTIHIDNGNETEWALSPDREPHFTTGDLARAARHITEA
ncbi:MAG: hydrolase, HAD-superfamily, subfamily [Planctomycetota bacterium]|nr:hydrolase, HAD-superfamily, subfamily [Planctomycetota bacterium]